MKVYNLHYPRLITEMLHLNFIDKNNLAILSKRQMLMTLTTTKRYNVIKPVAHNRREK